MPFVLEHVAWRGEFIQPETGFLSGVAQIAVRCQDHQSVHDCSVDLCQPGGLAGRMVRNDRVDQQVEHRSGGFGCVGAGSRRHAGEGACFLRRKTVFLLLQMGDLICERVSWRAG